jgi:hypothetical protein
VGDLYRLYTFAQRDEITYHLAALPQEKAPHHPEKLFNQVYMQILFDLGYEMASDPKGYPWEDHPPGYESKQVSKETP